MHKCVSVFVIVFVPSIVEAVTVCVGVCGWLSLFLCWHRRTDEKYIIVEEYGSVLISISK